MGESMTIWEWAALISAGILAGTFIVAKFMSIGTQSDEALEKWKKENGYSEWHV